MPGLVTVACKLPAGTVLQNYEMGDGTEPVLGGGSRAVKIYRPVGNPVRIFGPAKPFGAESTVAIVGGYALTHNIDKDWWDAWYKANATTDMVKNKLVFAWEKRDRVEAVAKEQKSILSGLEPLNPSTRIEGDRRVPVDPRWPRKKNGAVAVETDDGRELSA